MKIFTLRIAALTGIALGSMMVSAISAQAGILDVQEVRSESGLTAWLVEDHTIPVISLRFAFRDSGSAYDPADKQGLARLLSNTMDEGAGNLDSKAFQEKLADLSISLGFSTSRDQFSGSVKTLSANKAEAFRLLGLALTQPRFDAEAVARMREANLSRIKSDMSDPQWIAARIMNDTVFKDHPYMMNSGGTLTSLNKITPADLRTKVKEALTRNRLIISAAGDISAGELAQVIDQVFAALPESGTVTPVADIALPDTASTILYEKQIPQTIVNIYLPGIPVKAADHAAAEVMNFIFGGAGFGSRLMETIREKRGLTYGIYSGLSNLDHASVLAINSSSKNATAGELISLTREEMANFIQTPVTAKELHDAKTYLVGSVPLDLTSTDAISAYMLSFQSEGLPKNYLDLREAAIRAVTPADVEAVARKTLTPDKMTVVLVGTPEHVTPSQIVTVLPNVE